MTAAPRREPGQARRPTPAPNPGRVALAASSRRLKAEIARRRKVEETLRRSERHTGLLLSRSQRQQDELRLLSRRVLSAQEDERKRISRELHDVVAQMLTGIHVRLATLKVEAAAHNKSFSRKISHTQRLVEKSVDVVHRFALELRPAVLDDLGLIPALQAFMKRLAKETGLRASLTAFPGPDGLSSAQRTALYRVAQEALTNVVRHAQAGRVDVSLRRLPDAMWMQIRDDGRSFDVERTWRGRKSRSLGLIGMRERVEMLGGSLSIDSAPGRGTTLQAQIPHLKGPRELARP